MAGVKKRKQARNLWQSGPPGTRSGSMSGGKGGSGPYANRSNMARGYASGYTLDPGQRAGVKKKRPPKFNKPAFNKSLAKYFEGKGTTLDPGQRARRKR